SLSAHRITVKCPFAAPQIASVRQHDSVASEKSESQRPASVDQKLAARLPHTSHVERGPAVNREPAPAVDALEQFEIREEVARSDRRVPFLPVARADMSAQRKIVVALEPQNVKLVERSRSR